MNFQTQHQSELIKLFAQTCEYPEWMLLLLPDMRWGAFWRADLEGPAAIAFCEGRHEDACRFIGETPTETLAYMRDHRMAKALPSPANATTDLGRAQTISFLLRIPLPASVRDDPIRCRGYTQTHAEDYRRFRRIQKKAAAGIDSLARRVQDHIIGDYCRANLRTTLPARLIARDVREARWGLHGFSEADVAQYAERATKDVAEDPDFFGSPFFRDLVDRERRHGDLVDHLNRLAIDETWETYNRESIFRAAQLTQTDLNAEVICLPYDPTP